MRVKFPKAPLCIPNNPPQAAARRLLSVQHETFMRFHPFKFPHSPMWLMTFPPETRESQTSSQSRRYHTRVCVEPTRRLAPRRGDARREAREPRVKAGDQRAPRPATCKDAAGSA